MTSDASRDFLRHTLATLAYRGGKAVREAPEGFATLKISESSRTPLEILAHIGDLVEWAVALSNGGTWHNATPQSWDAEVARFFDALAKCEARLSDGQPLACSVEQLFQGPIADAFTHVGQLTMLRRVGGLPVRGENYFRADIAAGRVGREQSAPRREFD
jgi:hypothetical protein